jgi:hypothetical protein
MEKKMKIKNISVLFVALILVGAVSASAIKIPSAKAVPVAPDVSKSDSAAVATDEVQGKMKTVIAKSESTTEMFNNSLVKLNSVLGTQEQVEKLKTAKKDALAGEAANNLSAIAEQEGLKATINALSSVEKIQMVDAGYNVVLANLKFADVAKESKELVDMVSKDKQSALKMAGDVKNLNKVVTSTGNQLKSATTANNAVLKIFKAGDVKFTAPTCSDVLPKNIDLADAK